MRKNDRTPLRLVGGDIYREVGSSVSHAQKAFLQTDFIFASFSADESGQEEFNAK